MALAFWVAAAVLGWQGLPQTVVDVQQGRGAAAKLGDVVTVHFVAVNDAGKEIANTSRRGLPYTYRLAPEGLAPWMSWGVTGMKQGGVRDLVVHPDQGYGPEGVPPIVQGGTTLNVRVELLSFAPGPNSG